MNERETAEAIADRAAEWVARIDAAGDDPNVHAALEAWLAGDVRRRGAYFRAQAAWVSLDRAQVLACGQGEHEAEPARRRHTRTGLMWGGGIAAAAIDPSFSGTRRISPMAVSMRSAGAGSGPSM